MARPNGATPDSSDGHKLARAAVLALQNALGAARQHPDAEELWRPARRRAISALEAATRGAPLVLGLRAGAVYVGSEAVLRFQPGDRPFGQLREAGIGAVVLTEAIPTDRLELLLQKLTAMSDCEDADRELAALIDTASVPGIELRAAADLPSSGNDERVDWSALPKPPNVPPGVRAMIQRDGAANLPALAARQLFDDRERPASKTSTTVPAPSPCGTILAKLMERILAADDIATTTWLLTELDERPEAYDASRDDLLRLARSHCDQEWLKHKLDRGTSDELLQLSALVMQLGDDVAEEFAAAAAAVAHPLTQWLGELLGQSGSAQPDRFPQPDR